MIWEEKWQIVGYNSANAKFDQQITWQTCHIWRNTENKLIYFCMHYWIFILNFSLFLDLQLYKGRINATSHVIQHPMYGAGHKFRTLHLPVSTTLSEVLDRVSGKSDLNIYFSLTFLYVYRNFIIFIILLYSLRNYLMTWNGQDGFTFQNMMQCTKCIIHSSTYSSFVVICIMFSSGRTGTWKWRQAVGSYSWNFLKINHKAIL